MKKTYRTIAAVVLSVATLGVGSAEAIPLGFCPRPAPKPLCAKGWRPVCTSFRTCRSSAGEIKRVCRSWRCVRVFSR